MTPSMERIPQDQWQEAMRLMDEAQKHGTCDAAKRAVIESAIRANPASLPYFIDSMKQRRGELPS